jgi:competence protein ComEC
VRRLEALVLTHPHLDHFGEGPALLGSVDVRAVLDPAMPTGDEVYRELLSAAHARGVPWRRARAGDRWEVDGVVLEVLHPGPDDAVAGTDPNDASVVLHVRYGAFDALLTGDAPAAVERRIAARFDGGLEVLKVGHHGSATSSDSLLVWNAAPELALISVGRGNRYGHPSTEVVSRLGRVGATVRRTDRDGSIRVVARRDGRFTVTTLRRRRRRATQR